MQYEEARTGVLLVIARERIGRLADEVRSRADDVLRQFGVVANLRKRPPLT